MCGHFDIGGQFDELSAELQEALFLACSTKRAKKGTAAEVWLSFVGKVRPCVLLFYFCYFIFHSRLC